MKTRHNTTTYHHIHLATQRGFITSFPPPQPKKRANTSALFNITYFVPRPSCKIHGDHYSKYPNQRNLGLSFVSWRTSVPVQSKVRCRGITCIMALLMLLYFCRRYCENLLGYLAVRPCELSLFRYARKIIIPELNLAAFYEFNVKIELAQYCYISCIK